jgi:uncharacterized protein YdeI (YjbR/CyaY-like superfamily)
VTATRAGLEILHAVDRGAWRAWLAEHHASAPGVWLVYYRKATGRTGVSYDEAVEEALAFGWIDSKTNPRDEEGWLQMFTPRRPGSPWSRSNKERVARLEREGRMTPAGRALVEAAKRDGSWTKLDAVENLEVPPDLAKALAANPQAEQHFNAFSPSARRHILGWIASAKRPETRAKRIAETVRLAAQNVKANM